MNDIITNGTEIKQRIISELNNARQCIYLAMAYFTDRDIAAAIIEAKNRNVAVDIILSSNAQNDTVKLMLRGANISVHAFETGDARGIMHHKFCLVDNRISINGSYNYSYNASNNNVENIHVSDHSDIYEQLLAEFERLKYNIDHNIAVNAGSQTPANAALQLQPMNSINAFSELLHNLVYSSVQISTDEYKKQGYEKSKESGGNLDIFRTEYFAIKEEINVYATDDSLGNKKNILTSNVSGAFENKKTNLETEKQTELVAAKRDNELEIRQIKEHISGLKEEKRVFESGNQNTGERGLLQINKDIEKNKLEKKTLEQSFVVRKFWSVGTVMALIGLSVFIFYLSIFFASAIYKVFFEGNIIRASLEAGVTPALPQLVDANAIIKIFKQQGALFGIMATLFFVIPILLSNLELLGSKKKWVNNLCFWVGVLVFDIVVSTMVALNTDEIKCLLVGQESHLQIWEVIKHGEFWLIFAFGMLPLIITHYLIVNIENAYKNSQREIVDAEKARKIKLLDEETIDLNAEKESITSKINDKEEAIKIKSDKVQALETAMNNCENQIASKYKKLLDQVNDIFHDFRAKIVSGKIFTDEILKNVISAYKSGFIEFLPEYYAEPEVAKRVREIEQTIKNHN
jgi:hypothetical protein